MTDRDEPALSEPAQTALTDGYIGGVFVRGSPDYYSADQLHTYAAEYSAPLRAEIERLTAAVENCRLCAARHRHEPWAKDILRLLADHGIKGSPFRDDAKEKP